MRKSSRNYNLKDDYFNTIDTKRKAYWLGLLMADGFVGLETHSISLSMKESDSLLDHFVHDIELTKSIRTTVGSGYSKDSVTLTVNFSSDEMSKTLYNYGIKPNRKEFLTSIPDCVPDALISHFIRGYFDGDGSVCNYIKKCRIKQKDGSIKVYEYPKTKIDIIGNKNFLYTLFNYMDVKYSIGKSKNKNLFYGQVANQKEIVKMNDYLYRDDDLCIKRKQKGFETLCARVK